MKNSGRGIRNRQIKLFGTTLVTIAAACVFALAAHVEAQSPAAKQVAQNAASDAEKPAFEVASIKKDTSNTNMVRMGGPDVTQPLDVSRFSAANVTPKMLIGFAYDMRDFQISGGPSWIGSERFDIDAKVDDDLAQKLRQLPRDQQLGQRRLMIQSLLEDRFQLSVTHAQKELPIFALVVAKGGPKLTAAAPITSDSAAENPPVGPPPPGAVVRGGPPAPPPGGMMMSMNNGLAMVRIKAGPLSSLIFMLSQQLGRQIVDETGLKGTYDITLEFSPEGGMFGGPLPPRPPAAADAPDSSATSIFTALQEQLGLKLESKKGPVDTIIVEHIEEPTPN